MVQQHTAGSSHPEHHRKTVFVVSPQLIVSYVAILLIGVVWGALLFSPRFHHRFSLDKDPHAVRHEGSLTQHAPKDIPEFQALKASDFTCPASGDQSACERRQLQAVRDAVHLGFSHPEVWRKWGGNSSVGEAAQPVFGEWQFLSPRPASTSSNVPSSTKWIVITTIQKPTDAIVKWSLLREWRVVVVADTKTPLDWQAPTNVDFLSVAKQHELGYKITSLLPYKSYARKMIGYLYAMEHGAQVIYETDDDNAPRDEKLAWIKPEQDQVTVTKGRPGQAVNPYSFYGQCTLWPRGFPLTTFFQHGKRHCYPAAADTLERTKHIPVQQGLADLDPDMDAVWRLTRPEEIAKVRFQQRKPGVAYAAGTFSPYNSQNTAYWRSAFWALFLPTTVTLRVADIWRSYWAQRLMWEAGLSLYFAHATVEQIRNAHDYVKDFEDEMQMYVQTPSLLEYLTSWRCTHAHLFDCMLQLTHDMAQAGFWGSKDVQLMSAWIHDLVSLNVTAPPLVHREPGALPGVKMPPRASDALLAGDGLNELLELSNVLHKGLDPNNIIRQRTYMRSKQFCQMADYQQSNAAARAGHLLGRKVLPMHPIYPFNRTMYLSIIVATNNVNQALQHTRLSFMLKNVAEYTRMHKIGDNVEVIIVDYNTNEEEPHLLQQPSLHLPKTELSDPLIRVISVPNTLHRRMTMKMQAIADPNYWEYIAKNVGIRRACGENILVTNPDILLNQGIWQFIAEQKLKPTAYYRALRVGISIILNETELAWSQPQIMEFAERNNKITCGIDPLGVVPPGQWNWGVHWWFPNGLPSTAKWLKMPYDPNANTNRGREPIIGCPGDFIMAPRYAFHALRGHAEVAIPVAMDDWMVVTLAALGLESHYMPAPSVAWHQEHTRGYSGKTRAAYVGAEDRYQKIMAPLLQDMLAYGAHVVNDGNWGLGNYDLPEIYV